MNTETRIKVLRAAGAVSSGILLSLGFPGSFGLHHGLGAVIPLACVPLFAVWQTLPQGTRISETGRVFETKPFQRFMQAFFYAWIMGCACVCNAFFWVTKPAISFGGLPAWAAYGLFACYVTLGALYFCVLLFPFLVDAGRQHAAYVRPLPVVLLACCAVALETVCPRFFQWTLGSLMHSLTPINQWASVAGFSTVSLPIIITWAALGRLWKHPPLSLRTGVVSGSIVLMWAGLWAGGASRIAQWDRDILPKLPVATVGVIQPHFTFDFLKTGSTMTSGESAEARPSPADPLGVMKTLTEDLKKQTLAQGKKWALVIWPESTLPFEWWSADEATKKSLLDWVHDLGIPVLVQSSQVDKQELAEKGIGGSTFFSVSFLLRPNGSISQFHKKWVPMPFGESVPFEDVFPEWGNFLRRYVHNLSRLGRGKTFEALAFSEQDYVAPLICFDTIAPELPRRQTRFGQASLFVNQANFVWMGKSGAGRQFRELGRFRAIENARSFLLAANNGPTVFLDPLGRLLAPETPLFERAITAVDVPLVHQEQVPFTPYTQLGEFPLWAAAIVSATILLGLHWGERRK